jgi:isopentenyl-diphosphate delta-isomerase
MLEYIITVDELDNEVGSIEKLEAHKLGVLHRAFSILVYNQKGQVLLQKRNIEKYHSPGLWSNTCCSHQRVGETLEEAVTRRLEEELGFTCDLKEMFHFIYKVEFDNNLMEHELDHVFFGHYDGEITPNKEEVDEIRWMDMDELRRDMEKNPDIYTYWFKILMNRPEMKFN